MWTRHMHTQTCNSMFSILCVGIMVRIVLVLCVGYTCMCWSSYMYVLVLCVSLTCTVCVGLMCLSYMCWSYVLVLCVGLMCWPYV